MKITSFEHLGTVLRATRLALNVPLADLADTLETSQTLLRRHEQGHTTIAIQKLFATMAELGIEMHLFLPAAIQDEAIVSENGVAKRKRARP